MKKKMVSKPQEDATQLDLGMKEPLKNKYYTVKGKADKLLLQIEVRKFLKDSFFWFVTIISVILIVQQVLIIRENIPMTPSQIPLLNYNLLTVNKLIPRIYIYMLPFISSISLIVGEFFVIRYFNKEKSLTKFLLLAILLVTISSSIVLIELISKF